MPLDPEHPSEISFLPAHERNSDGGISASASTENNRSASPGLSTCTKNEMLGFGLKIGPPLSAVKRSLLRGLRAREPARRLRGMSAGLGFLPGAVEVRQGLARLDPER